MRDARLPLANPGNGEAAIGPADCEMQAGGAALSGKAPGEICIRKQVWLQGTWPIPDPSHQPIVVCGMNVADQAVKTPVAQGGPLRKEACQVRYCLEYVGPRIASTVQDLHKDPGSNWG